MLSDVDTLLFSLLILRSLTDSKGQIWHSLPLQYYVIEVTYMDVKFETAHQKLLPNTMSLLKLLPTIDCQSPFQVLQQYKMQKRGTNYFIVPHNGKFSRTINSTVFVDFVTPKKLFPQSFIVVYIMQ